MKVRNDGIKNKLICKKQKKLPDDEKFMMNKPLIRTTKSYLIATKDLNEGKFRVCLILKMFCYE